MERQPSRNLEWWSKKRHTCKIQIKKKGLSCKSSPIETPGSPLTSQWVLVSCAEPGIGPFRVMCGAVHSRLCRTSLVRVGGTRAEPWGVNPGTRAVPLPGLWAPGLSELSKLSVRPCSVTDRIAPLPECMELGPDSCAHTGDHSQQSLLRCSFCLLKAYMALVLSCEQASCHTCVFISQVEQCAEWPAGEGGPINR